MLVVEMSAGQMVDDVKLAVEGRCPVELLARLGGLVPAAAEITDRLKSLAARVGLRVGRAARLAAWMRGSARG